MLQLGVRCKVEQEVDFWASSVCQARRPECNEVLVMQNNDLRMEENFILVLGGATQCRLRHLGTGGVSLSQICDEMCLAQLPL